MRKEGTPSGDSLVVDCLPGWELEDGGEDLLEEWDSGSPSEDLDPIDLDISLEDILLGEF